VLGISDEKLAALPVYRSSHLFTPIEKLVLDLATAMCKAPAAISDELRDELHRHFSPAQVTELAAAIAWENHRARLNRALGIRPMGLSDGGYCVVPHSASGEVTLVREAPSIEHD
jgi:alkylhydroperoxidase family enzyme